MQALVGGKLLTLVHPHKAVEASAVPNDPYRRMIGRAARRVGRE